MPGLSGLISSVQFISVAQLCPILCDPMNQSMPGLPVHHKLLEFTQTHVHWVGDAIQPSHPLSSPSPPALNLSRNQGLFKWVSSLHQVAKVLEFQSTSVLPVNTQDWSLGWAGTLLLGIFVFPVLSFPSCISVSLFISSLSTHLSSALKFCQLYFVILILILTSNDDEHLIYRVIN